MLTDYVQAAMKHATYDVRPNGHYYGEIPGLQGIWSNAETLEDSRKELQEVLEEWIAFRLAHHLPIPPLDGIELAVPAL